MKLRLTFHRRATASIHRYTFLSFPLSGRYEAILFFFGYSRVNICPLDSPFVEIASNWTPDRRLDPVKTGREKGRLPNDEFTSSKWKRAKCYETEGGSETSSRCYTVARVYAIPWGERR